LHTNLFLSRNTLELLHQSEQGEEAAEALVDQEGSADGAGPAATSLAHLRPGKFQYFLVILFYIAKVLYVRLLLSIALL
jgi:hypothetical protein